MTGNRLVAHTEEYAGRLLLKAQEFCLFLSRIATPAVVLDTQGVIVEANEGFQRLTGSHGDRGKSFCELLDGSADPKGADWDVGEVIDADDGAVCRDLCFRRADSRCLWGRVNAVFVPDSYEPALSLIVITVQNITDILAHSWERPGAVSAFERSEAQARQQLLEIETIYRAVPVGLAVLDRDHRFVRINQRLAEINGFTPEEHIGRTVREMLPDLADSVEPLLDKVLTKGEPLLDLKISGETPAQPGVKRTWIEQWLPVRDPSGAIVGVNITADEVTEKLRVEEELRRASAAKDQFLATLSHELRTPLTPIVAAVEMLERRADIPAEVKEIYGTIRRNVALEARLIDDLLDLNRVMHRKLNLRMEPCSLREVIEQAIEICRAGFEQKKQMVTCAIEGGDFTVFGDSARLQQVVWNLLSNAVKFTPEGGAIGIRARLLSPGQVEVAVSDTGIGLSRASLSTVFSVFDQGESGAGRAFGGLGLGLAIAKGLVELHGGQISASSPGEGQGSTFSFTLPVVASVQTSRHTETQCPEKPNSRRSRKILLVEDHGDTAEMMKTVLELDGHEVVHSGTVAEAIRAASAQPFDLLLCDLGLPDGSGCDVMSAIRKEKELIGIALTGYGRDEDIQRCLHSGFKHHLTKPVSIEALEDLIAKF